MWRIKEIWSGLIKTGYKEIHIDTGSIYASKRYCRGIPYYLFNRNNEVNPMVVYVHGYTDTPLLGLSTALDLTKEGFTVVLPEAKWHGQEKPMNFKQLFSSNNFIYSIFNVFKETIKGISEITTYLQKQSLIAKGEAGICGFSMGGYISYVLPLLDSRYTISAPVSGSPYHYDAKAQEHFRINMNEKIMQNLNYIPEPSQYVDKLRNIKWLIQHAKDDDTVSFEGSLKFVNLLTVNQTKESVLKSIFYDFGGHKYEPYMRDEIVRWFSKHLKA